MASVIHVPAGPAPYDAIIRPSLLDAVGEHVRRWEALKAQQAAALAAAEESEAADGEADDVDSDEYDAADAA